MTKANKKAKSKGGKADDASAAAADEHEAASNEGARAQRLALDEKDPSLNVGPDGRPLFTSAPSLSQLTRKDTCSYFKFR